MDDARLAKELDARLNALVTKHFRGKPLGDFEDNTTRMRATELLAEMRGKRKAQIDVRHSGSIDSAVHIYLPDNGRDDDGD